MGAQTINHDYNSKLIVVEGQSYLNWNIIYDFGIKSDYLFVSPLQDKIGTFLDNDGIE